MEITEMLLSGGGVKFLCHLGAFKYIYKTDNIQFNLKKIGGVSSGSIIALGVVLSTDLEKVEKILLKQDFSKLIKFKLKFLKYLGLDNGKILINYIEHVLKSTTKFAFNRHTTFKELYDMTNIQFDVYASNLNLQQLDKFNYINCPNFKVLDAIRLSMSIPFVMTFKKYRNNVYADGAVINPFPIKEYYIDDNLPESFLGIFLSRDENIVINSLKNYIKAIIYSMTRIDKFDKTVCIKSLSINTLDFKISKTDKQKLIDYGYKKMKDYHEEIIVNPRLNKLVK